MDVLYFAFANSPTSPLPYLSWEIEQLKLILDPLEANGHFKVIWDENATLGLVKDKLYNYKDDLVLFHFSGHAGPDELQLLGTTAKSLGIQEQLEQCKNLKLVFLNGCATVAQVDLLQKLTRALVIATYQKVRDKNAAQFAVDFYKVLSYFDTVENAFAFARAGVLALDDRLNIPRGIFKNKLEQRIDNSSWGLFGGPYSEASEHWYLPNRLYRELPRDYEPNKELVTALLLGLAPYVPGINNLPIEQADQQLAQKRRVILENLPHPLSELMRYVLVPRTDSSQDKFYDQLGKGRLRQIFCIYLTSVELMTCIALAELWDSLTKCELHCPASLQRLIKAYLQQKRSSRLQVEHFNLYKEVADWIKQNKNELFVEELQVFNESIQINPDFRLGFDFFGYLEGALDQLSDTVSKALCIEAERFLSVLMKSMGFISRYTIASVKNINVLIYRHQSRPTYKHSIVKLQQSFVGLEEEQPTLTKILSPSAVVLLHKEKLEELANFEKNPDLDAQNPLEERFFLNLFPFILDQNAFDEKASIAKLHLLNNYVPSPLAENGTYTFRHIYVYEDQLLSTDTSGKSYNLIIDEFDSFAQLIFQQPMKTALS